MFASGSTATSVKTGNGSCTLRIGTISPRNCEKRNRTAGLASRNSPRGRNLCKRVRISTTLLFDEITSNIESGTFAVGIGRHREQLLEIGLSQLVFAGLGGSL